MRKLADALFPKTRQRVLAATLIHPKKWWYLSDLARHLSVSPSSLQRELVSLVDSGILERREEAGSVYFKPDANCPIFSELQSIIIKTAGVTDRVSEVFKGLKKKIDVAFIYGSFASQTEIATSDIDLMVIGTLGLSDLSPKLERLEKTLGREVNPTVYSPREFASTRDGHFLSKVMAGPKIFIIGSDDDLGRLKG